MKNGATVLGINFPRQYVFNNMCLGAKKQAEQYFILHLLLLLNSKIMKNSFLLINLKGTCDIIESISNGQKMI